MVCVLHVMLDVLSVLKKASISFQERNATDVDIHTHLQAVCGLLKKYQTSFGPQFQSWISTACLKLMGYNMYSREEKTSNQLANLFS